MIWSLTRAIMSSTVVPPYGLSGSFAWVCAKVVPTSSTVPNTIAAEIRKSLRVIFTRQRRHLLPDAIDAIVNPRGSSNAILSQPPPARPDFHPTSPPATRSPTLRVKCIVVYFSRRRLRGVCASGSSISLALPEPGKVNFYRAVIQQQPDSLSGDWRSVSKRQAPGLSGGSVCL